jgi:hypothetical protein
VPGMGVSVRTVLSSLERQPGEFIEDPWVQDRMTLVAEQADQIAAAARLHRYFADERAGSPTPVTPRSSTWPGSKTCCARPRRPSPVCRSAGRPG